MNSSHHSWYMHRLTQRHCHRLKKAMRHLGHLIEQILCTRKSQMIVVRSAHRHHMTYWSPGGCSLGQGWIVAMWDMARLYLLGCSCLIWMEGSRRCCRLLMEWGVLYLWLSRHLDYPPGFCRLLTEMRCLVSADCPHYQWWLWWSCWRRLRHLV